MEDKNDSKTVRCADCGYLAVRGFNDRMFCEVEETMRKGGKSPRLYSGNEPGGLPAYEHDPICFMRMHELTNEWKEIIERIRHKPRSSDAVTYEGMAFQEVLNKDRICSEFTEWKQGFAPKDHREMDVKEIEREHIRRREDADRKWRSEQAEKERSWRKEDREWQATESQKADARHFQAIRILGWGMIWAVGLSAVFQKDNYGVAFVIWLMLHIFPN